MGVGGRLFVFTPNQQQFLMNLQKMKNVMAASLAVGKDEEWGKKFLSSQKFRKYLSLKMKAFSDRNGLDVDWWYGFGKHLTDGYKEIYRVECVYCGFRGEMDEYEVEATRADDMKLEPLCPACFKTVEYKKEREAFAPTREQVEGWKEIGSRLLPKVERTHHTFENVDIVFQSEGESA